MTDCAFMPNGVHAFVGSRVQNALDFEVRDARFYQLFRIHHFLVGCRSDAPAVSA